jgi:acetyl esterase/lipase
VSALNPVPSGKQHSAFSLKRLNHPTRLVRRGKSPQGHADPVAADGVRPLTYTAESRTLKAWLASPHSDILRGPSGYPTIVYIHAGFALTSEDIRAVEPLRAAGFVVFLPTFRAENANPGDHEMLFGELDDVVAAVQFVRQQSGTDPSKIAVFGTATGGMLAALFSLLDGPAVLDTGSIAGIPGEDAFDLLPIPFENTDEERSLRLFLPNAADIQQPHLACVSGQDVALVGAARQARARAASTKLLELEVVSGPHPSSVSACIERYRERLTGRLAQLN